MALSGSSWLTVGHSGGTVNSVDALTSYLFNIHANATYTYVSQEVSFIHVLRLKICIRVSSPHASCEADHSPPPSAEVKE